MYRSKKLKGQWLGSNKTVQKSVRLLPEIYEYIMVLPGDNFSDKLENLVISHASMDKKRYDRDPG